MSELRGATEEQLRELARNCRAQAVELSRLASELLRLSRDYDRRADAKRDAATDDLTVPLAMEPGSAEARIKALEAALRLHRCNIRRTETVGECIDRGHCACSCGLLIGAAADAVAPGNDRIEALEMRLINRKLSGTDALYDRIEALEAALKLATVIDANHVAAGNRLAEALAHLIEFTDMTGQGCAAQQVAARVDLAAWRATEKGETNGNG